jgi:hypothetical protein
MERVYIFFTSQVNYIIKLIKPILQKKLAAVDVSTSATDKYNTKIQSRLSRSVWVGCNSWYRVDGKGKVNSIFPGMERCTSHARQMSFMGFRFGDALLVVTAKASLEGLRCCELWCLGLKSNLSRLTPFIYLSFYLAP